MHLEMARLHGGKGTQFMNGSLEDEIQQYCWKNFERFSLLSV